HAQGRGVVNDVHAAGVAIGVAVDEIIDPLGVAAIIDDHVHPVAIGLGDDTGDGALEKERPIFGASDYSDAANRDPSVRDDRLQYPAALRNAFIVPAVEEALRKQGQPI